MDRGDRAKQFAPFEALKGLRQALLEKEKANEKNHSAKWEIEKKRQSNGDKKYRKS